MNPPFDPQQAFYRWGPIPGKYLFAAGDSLDSFFIELPQRFGESWPDSLWLERDGRIIWLTPFRPLWGTGEKLFLKKIMDSSERQRIRAAWDHDVSNLTACERQIASTDLRSLENEELSSLMADFYSLLVTYWDQTFFPEIGNYGAENHLTNLLKKKFKDDSEVSKIMEVLTAPESLSFYRREEIELSQADDLEAHQQKYFWLQNSHNSVRILPVSYFAERKSLISPNIRSEASTNLENILQRKVAIQKEYQLSDEIMQIGKTLAASIVWQDDRKMNTFISLHYKQLLLDEVARRTGLVESDLFSLDLRELGELVRGQDFSAALEERKTANGVWCQRGRIERLSTEDTLAFWDLYAEEKADVQAGENSVTGTLASKGPGVVRGKVQILLDPMQPFEEGNVLITTLTSPEYVFAMRKAVAIVTDTGGVGSHAAITSRELNKPCVVGTKIATKVFKNGDMVEVDAERGVVRKL